MDIVVLVGPCCKISEIRYVQYRCMYVPVRMCRISRVGDVGGVNHVIDSSLRIMYAGVFIYGYPSVHGAVFSKSKILRSGSVRF